MSEVDWKGMSEVDWKGMSKVDWSFELLASSSEGRGSRVVWYEVAVLGSEPSHQPGTSNTSADALSRRDDAQVLPGGTDSVHNTTNFFQPHHI